MARASQKMKSIKELDNFIQNIVSNFYVDGKEVASVSLKPPFDKILHKEKRIEILDGSQPRKGYFLITMSATLKRPRRFRGKVEMSKK